MEQKQNLPFEIELLTEIDTFTQNIINPELDFYKAMSQIEQENYYGMEITNGRQQSINYRDSNRLINDILTKYGDEWLETEK